MSGSRWPRRQFVLTGFQRQWLIDECFFIFVFGAAVVAAVFLPFILQLDDPQELTASAEFLWLHERFWLVLPGLVLVLALHAVRSSHRITGSLSRFSLIFEQLSAGDLTMRVRLRADDYLKDEATVLNRAVQTLHEKVSRLRDEVEHIAFRADQEDCHSEAGVVALRQAIGRATHAARELNTNRRTDISSD